MNPFGFEGMKDFFSSAFRYNELEVTFPVTLIIGSINFYVFNYFGIQFMEMIALIVLFILEIISGIWASNVNFIEYKNKLDKNRANLSEAECCELQYKIDKYKFSSSKLKRAGAVMGFWLIILFIVHQFSLDSKGTVSTVFNNAHFVFLSYIISIYIVSVIENAMVISGTKDKYLPLKNVIKNIFIKNNKDEKPDK
jgi:hypothetical protein